MQNVILGDKFFGHPDKVDAAIIQMRVRVKVKSMIMGISLSPPAVS
jgi:hypothetical protein